MRHSTSPGIPVFHAILLLCVAPVALPIAAHLTFDLRTRAAFVGLAGVALVVGGWVAAVSTLLGLAWALKWAGLIAAIGAVGWVIEAGYRPRFDGDANSEQPVIGHTTTNRIAPALGR